MCVPSLVCAALIFTPTSRRFRFPNLFIKNVKDVRFHSVCFLANLSDVSKVFEQVSLVHALARYGPKAFQVVVPYCACTVR